MGLILIKRTFKISIPKQKKSIRNILHKSFNFKDKSENIISYLKILSNCRTKRHKLLIFKMLNYKSNKQSILFLRPRIKSNKSKINGNPILIL